MARTRTSRLKQWVWSDRLDKRFRTDFVDNATALEQLVAIGLNDVRANRPAPGVRDRLFWAKDERVLYYDDGTQWSPAAAGPAYNTRQQTSTNNIASGQAVPTAFWDAVSGSTGVTYTGSGYWRVDVPGLYQAQCSVAYAASAVGIRQLSLVSTPPATGTGVPAGTANTTTRGSADLATPGVGFIIDRDSSPVASGAAYETRRVSAVLSLLPGAQVSFEAYQSSGGQLAVGQPGRASVVRLGPA